MMKKILAVSLAAFLALSFAACGSKSDEQTTAAETEVAAVEDVVTTVPAEDITEAEGVSTAEIASEPISEEATAVSSADTSEVATDPDAETVSETTTEEANKAPQTKEEIVEFYKKAAAETDKTKPTVDTKMELTQLDGGSGIVGSLLNALKPIAKSALEKNSTPTHHISGGYENLTADDVASATATTSADGKYTTVTINLKEQTDGFTADSRSGHVGHGITVLGNVQNAIDELKGVSVDTSNGSVALRYNNAKINVKIDNTTGRIVSGTWSYKVNITLNNVQAKIGIFKATLDGTKAEVTKTEKFN